MGGLCKGLSPGKEVCGGEKVGTMPGCGGGKGDDMPGGGVKPGDVRVEVLWMIILKFSPLGVLTLCMPGWFI